MNFPLYDQLVTQSKTIKVELSDFDDWIRQVEKLPLAHKENLFRIVLYHYYLTNPKQKGKGMPYGSKPLAGGLGVIQKFPDDLIPILGVYLHRIQHHST